jgi:hypothetical protein
MALAIKPTHSAIRMQSGDYDHLKSWAVEGSDDGASWMEPHRCHNNTNFKDRLAVKPQLFRARGGFRRIRLCQTV